MDVGKVIVVQQRNCIQDRFWPILSTPVADKNNSSPILIVDWPQFLFIQSGFERECLKHLSTTEELRNGIALLSLVTIGENKSDASKT